ncbi:MAG: hypothetical protein PHG74_05460 [Kiritimatiellae bacterium]|jgi:hypothetical protein|nr:hypothetical protein [Kiritimatiellia bacterium]MDD3583450.1 hypothetical protein [Kiritimatiellia bacterium]HHU15091.1 hypothetical protein [Lentisphaerota bacterium]
MAFDDIILHDVKGVYDFSLTKDECGWTFTARCGIGILTGGFKPTVPFTKGVVCFDEPVGGKTLCDDAQLVAAYVEAFEGYNPFIGKDGAEWARRHTAPGDRTFSFDEGPLMSVKPRSKEDAERYLFEHGIFHPGTPV